MAEITIPYTPRQWAISFHDSPKRWLILVLHRRAGKTTATLNHLQRDAIRTPNARYAYVAPTYKLAKNVAWDIIKHYSNVVPGREYNESELSVKYPNGSKITLYGSDNPDALRGMGLWGVVFDEYSQQPSNIFSEIIRPALSDHSGYAIWIGTPKGKNDFFRLYEKAKSDKDWFSMLLGASESRILSEQELADARKTMSENEYNQEFECSFEASIKGAYYSTQLAEARKQGRIKIVPYDRSLKVFTVWDLGVGQALGVGFYQKSGNETRMIDYWEGSNQDGIPQAVKELRNKPYVYGTIFLPHDATTTSIDTGLTRVQTLRNLWPNAQITIAPKLPVDDGIEKGKLFWSRLWVNESKCQVWLDYMGQYKQEWDDNRGMFRETPYHDFTCISGETKIRTLNGWKKIKEIKQNDYVWGYSLEEHRLISTRANFIGKTGIGKKVLEIGLDNGKSIKTTPEHLWLLRNETYKRADELKVGESLMPFYEQLGSGGKYIHIDLNDGTYGLEHKIVYSRFNGYVEYGYHIDHIDNNHFNNYPSNLQKLRQDEHCGKTFAGRNNEERKEIDKTDYSQEIYGRSESLIKCKFCGDYFNGNFKTLYCSIGCKTAQRRNRDKNGLVPSRNKELVNAKVRKSYWKKKNHKIIYIKDGGVEDVYDLEVPETHNFVAEGIVLHNSHAADIHRYAALIEDRMRNEDDNWNLARTEITEKDLDPYRPERTFNDNFEVEENIL